MLSQLARIPYQQLARLIGDITVAGGVAIIAVAGRAWTVAADPVRCGPCAVGRWLRTHHIIVSKIATRVVADHLDDKAQTPFPPTAISRVALSRLARDLLDGTITVHRELPVQPIEPTVAETVQPVPAPAPGYGLQQHRAALDRRRADIAELAGVATELGDVDRRAVELNRRITELLDSAIPP